MDKSAETITAQCRCGESITPGQRSCLTCITDLVVDQGLDVLQRMDRIVDPTTGEVLCVGCGSPINPVRVLLKHDKTCIGCQTHLEDADHDRLKMLAARAPKALRGYPGHRGEGDDARARGRRLPRAASA